MKTTMPMLTREASFEPKTWSEDDRTCEMVWTTGAKVRRSSFLDGDFDEELIVTEETVDMGRLSSGRAPLLAAHRSTSLRDVLGVVETAWILGPNGRKEGRAKVRFSEREDVAPVIADVRAGILRNVSVGYSVSKWEKRQQKGDEVPVMRAVRWTPMELSLVPMGADAAAQVRNRPETYPTEIVEESVEMERHVADPAAIVAAADPAQVLSDNTFTNGSEGERGGAPEPRPAPSPDHPGPQPPPPTQPVPPQPSAEPEASPDRFIAARAVDLERARCSGINLTARKLSLDQRHADKLITEGVPLDVARERLIDLNHDQHKDTAVNSVVVTRDESEVKGRAMVDALLYRVGNQRQPTEQVRQFGYQYMSLIDMARECLESQGIRTRGLPPMKIAEMSLQPSGIRVSGGLHTTSDFANVLSGTINTTLRGAYEQAAPTFRAWARRTTAPDYRAINRVQLGGAPRLSTVNEHGEYTRGTMTDSKESYQIVKYGKVIGVTREVIVNDYLDVFGRVPQALAMSAAALESDVVYKVLLANAAMADGVPLFHATHGNVITAAAIGLTSIGEGFSLMSVQSNDNGSVMNIMARYLLVPPGIRPAAEQFVNGSIVPAQTTNVVPAYMQGLMVITEPRLSTGVTIDGVTTAGDTNGWYMIADSGSIDTVEYAYLEGEEGVYTETRNGFDIDGVEVKVRLDFGAKAIDWRGLASNVGA